MQQDKSIEHANDLVLWNYYRDKATGRVFSIREADCNRFVGVQCFCKSAKDCAVLKPYQLKELNLELYATNFKKAFNRYWRENRQRLILENKAEIAGVKLPENFFEYE